MKWTIALVGILFGCAGNGKNGEPNCTISDLSGMASAEMDGAYWAADAGSWNPNGAGIQIILTFDGPDRSMTIRGTRDEDGTDIAERLEAEDFPINVSLSGEDGTGGIMDGRFSKSYASNEASGNLTILDLDGTTMSACFSFTAVSDDSTMIEVSNGMAEVDQL